MSEYLIQGETLTGIADKIRPLLGLTGTMTPEQMQTNLDTEASNITAALAALTEKGVEVPEGANSNALAGLIAAIEAGGSCDMYTLVTFEEETLSYTVNHNLGSIPSHFAAIIVDSGETTVSNIAGGGIASWYSNELFGRRIFNNTSRSGTSLTTTRFDAGGINKGSIITADESTLTISISEYGGYKFSAGATYLMVVIK